MKNFKVITKNGALEILKTVLSSKFYPFITAAVTLLNYYLGWDIVTIYFISITGILILLLLDDVSPIISVFLFMSVMISLKNSPSPIMGNSDYYFRTEILVPLIIALVAFISAAVFRVIKTIARKKFTVTPLFFGLCAFAAVLFFNGIFSRNYNPKNLLYGLIMAASFLGIFCVLKDNLKLDSVGFERIAFGFLAFSALLLTELIVAYFTTENLFSAGNVINRDSLIFGWGVYNTFGVFLTMCIPAVIYLAGKLKYGFILTLYSILVFVGIFMSCSKQAMFGAIIIYAVCALLLLIKGRNRKINVCIYAAAAAAALILIIVFREKVGDFFKDIFENFIKDNKFSGTGRDRLWIEAIDHYRSAPLFGMGFYVEFSYYAKSGLGFIPHMCHNTVFQLMSCCGTIGIIVYIIHRIQTIRSYFKNPTPERTFIALAIVALLLISLFDNHLFNIFPTIIYSSLLAVLSKNEAKA